MERAPLTRDVTRLKVVHRQRVARQGDAEPAPAATLTLAPPTAAGARRGWQALLDTEHESIVIASWMTAALARLGAPLDLVGAFGRVVEDEIRHVDVCAQVIERLGGAPTIAHGPLPLLPTELARGSAGELETISALVGFFCVFELLSGLVFREALDACADELPRWAVGEIYRDEAFHGAFGFEAARHFVPKWTDSWRDQLARRVEADVRRFEARVRGLDGTAAIATDELAALERLGLLAPPRLLTVFYAGVQHELVPRLAELGIPVQIALVPAGSQPDRSSLIATVDATPEKETLVTQA